MRTINYVPFTDLLSHAVRIGYDWNNAIDFMNKLRPQYESFSHDYYAGDFSIDAEGNIKCAYSLPEEAVKVMVSFFEHNKVSEITVADE